MDNFILICIFVKLILNKTIRSLIDLIDHY